MVALSHEAQYVPSVPDPAVPEASPLHIVDSEDLSSIFPFCYPCDINRLTIPAHGWPFTI